MSEATPHEILTTLRATFTTDATGAAFDRVLGDCAERLHAAGAVRAVAAGAGDRPPAPHGAPIGGNVSDTMTPVAKDDPRWLAWQQYVRTPDFGNTRSWPVKGPEYIDGALWAAFIVGWESAGAVRPTPRAAPRDAILEAAVLAAHRRFHGKVGCPGGDDCYVCRAEEELHAAGAASPAAAPPPEER